MNQKIVNWYKVNIKALMKIYGEVEFDREKIGWILIHYYQLPPCFNQKTSAFLLITPQENLMKRDGFEFYLNKRLRRVDGKPTRRLFEDNQEYNRYAQKGYARLSFHFYDFRPHSDARMGDNLVDICESLYNFLGDERGLV